MVRQIPFKITDEMLRNIIEDHRHYLQRDCDDWRDKIADFSYLDLSCMDLQGADLRGAIFDHTNLHSANLQNARLENAYFCHANLYGANLCKAILIDARLENAYLKTAVLIGADLTNANLISANLQYANLIDTDLTRANLCHANLHKTNLTGATLTNTDFSCANLLGTIFDNTIGGSTEYRTGKILKESIIGYKKCYDNLFARPILVTLEIPKGAVVFSVNGKKCRTNRAKVIDIEGTDRAYSSFKYMSYYIGDEFDIKNFNCVYNVECAEGIHFFTDKKDAKKYLNYFSRK